MGCNAKNRYRVFDNLKLVGTYTAVEAGELIGCSPKIVPSYASEGGTYQKRWSFELVEDTGKGQEELLCKDWDFTRKALPLVAKNMKNRKKGEQCGHGI